MFFRRKDEEAYIVATQVSFTKKFILFYFIFLSLHRIR